MSEIRTAEQPKPETKSYFADKLPTLIAITTVILAVCTTLASFKAAGYGNRMVLAQSQASDQWSFYQAKSIKETSYQVQRDALALAAQQAGQAELYTAKIAEFDQEIARYKKEKNEIIDEAKNLEKVRDSNQQLNARFGEAMVFLQIGILFTSLAAINKVPIYWYLSMVSGGAGIWMFLRSLYLTL